MPKLSKRMKETPLQVGKEKKCRKCKRLRAYIEALKKLTPGSASYKQTIGMARYKCSNCPDGSYKFDNEVEEYEKEQEEKQEQEKQELEPEEEQEEVILFGGKRHEGKVAVKEKLYGQTVRSLNARGLTVAEIVESIGSDNISVVSVYRILRKSKK